MSYPIKTTRSFKVTGGDVVNPAEAVPWELSWETPTSNTTTSHPPGEVTYIPTLPTTVAPAVMTIPSAQTVDSIFKNLIDYTLGFKMSRQAVDGRILLQVTLADPTKKDPHHTVTLNYVFNTSEEAMQCLDVIFTTAQELPKRKK